MRFLARHNLPQAFSRSPDFRTTFYFSRIAIFWSSIIGIFIVHTIPIQLCALGFYYIVSAISFTRNVQMQTRKWASIDFERQRRETAEKGVVFENDIAASNAERNAERMIKEIMEENGRF